MRMDGSAVPKPMGWTDVYVDAGQGDVPSLPERVAHSPDVLVASLL